METLEGDDESWDSPKKKKRISYHPKIKPSAARNAAQKIIKWKRQPIEQKQKVTSTLSTKAIKHIAEIATDDEDDS